MEKGVHTNLGSSDYKDIGSLPNCNYADLRRSYLKSPRNLILTRLHYTKPGGKKMVSRKPIVWIRLREEERKLLKEIAKRYDVSESDVVKIALIEFARNHGIEVS